MVTPKHHKIDSIFELTHVVQSGIGTVYFYNKNILVVEINEGVELSYLSGAKLLLRCLLYIKGRPFVYLSNRINSYATVPTDYHYLHRIRSLKALAIVRREEYKFRPTPIETIFCEKPFELHHDLQEAMEWAQATLEKNESITLKE